MAKGRYLKSAERACVSKARFDTAEAAIAHSDHRYRAYLCPVCHHYHLTSRGGAASPSAAPAPPPPPKPSGPKLGDLDWTPILDPQPKPPKRPPSSSSYVPPKPPPPRVEPEKIATFVSVGKDRRAHLLVQGELVKSRPVKDRGLLVRLLPQIRVRTDGQRPPTILGLA